MHIEIADNGAFGSALVHLRPSEEFVSEAGSMFRASDNVDIDVTTRSRSSGGIMSGIKRMIAGENFFFSRYSVVDDRDAEIGLAPSIARAGGPHRVRRQRTLGLRGRELPRLRP